MPEDRILRVGAKDSGNVGIRFRVKLRLRGVLGVRLGVRLGVFVVTRASLGLGWGGCDGYWNIGLHSFSGRWGDTECLGMFWPLLGGS